MEEETAVDRGVKFELEILRTLKENVDMDFHRRKAEITSGDNGVDIEGLFRNYFVVVQCKNRVDILRDLEAVISRYPRNTIGILVIPCKANYTKNIKELKNLCKLF
ncbi:6567_t:CDS:2 [Entrophospora sp. SA101]|nr:6567_t:CDS:2 [Entrophospora sp. SA101]